MTGFFIFLLCFYQLATISSTSMYPIGKIRNVSMRVSNINPPIINGTCNECQCAILLNATYIVAFNCFQMNNTCQLFSNNFKSNSFWLQNDRTSSFYFYASLIDDLTSITVSSSLWSFENNTFDSLSGFDGILMNSPTYKTPGINGYGSALSFIQTSSQYVNISTYRNLSDTSFTIEMWFYWTNLSSGRFGLFGQYQSKTTSEIIHFEIRNYKLYMGFYDNDLTGSTSLQTNCWYHAAFVYDYSPSTQTIYLNGQMDAHRLSLPYKGTSGSMTIGMTTTSFEYFFSGYIDEVLLTMRAKDSSEILDDATLVTWHSFDNISSYYDVGPLKLNVTTFSITSVNGRVNQAISFTSNSSYYQMHGFILLGVSNYSYSITLWIYPISDHGSVLVHLSTTSDGQGWCADLLGFSSNGTIVTTGCNGNSSRQVVGPILPLNVWTHIVSTYSPTNGVRLYVNGTSVGSTGSMAYEASSLVNILTLGNGLQGTPYNIGGTCHSQSIVPNVYHGYIDEFRVYSRELDINEILILANP